MTKCKNIVDNKIELSVVKFLNDYISNLEVVLVSDDKSDWKEILENHRVVIEFMQHERLIHLLVTLTFGLGFLLMMGVTLISRMGVLGWVDLLLFVLLVPYIFHYFRLENGVQKLYFLDEKIKGKVGK